YKDVGCVHTDAHAVLEMRGNERRAQPIELLGRLIDPVRIAHGRTRLKHELAVAKVLSPHLLYHRQDPLDDAIDWQPRQMGHDTMRPQRMGNAHIVNRMLHQEWLVLGPL